MSCSNSGSKIYSYFAACGAVLVSSSCSRIATNILISSSLSPSSSLRNTCAGNNYSSLTGRSGTTHEGYESLGEVRTVLGVSLSSRTTGKVNIVLTGCYSVTCNFAVGAVCSRIGVNKLSIRVSCGELGITNVTHHRGNEDSCENTDEGMTTRQISETIEDIYGFEVSDGMVSDITDRLLPQIEEWQNRPLDEVYPVVFIDAVHFSVRDNGQIKKLAAYVILAVSLTGHKEVLSIHIGENESAKYWLGVLNELKNRGVKDILVICTNGLSGMKEAVAAAYPQTELQRCIVHQVRNTLKYVGEKNKKEFANDLKAIYQAPSEKAALEQLERVTDTPPMPLKALTAAIAV